jgi:hypothetical protein
VDISGRLGEKEGVNWKPCGVIAALWFGLVEPGADWPMLRGNAEHDGLVAGELAAHYRLVYARHFPGERLGTAMEPIVAHGSVYVGTHSGRLYALDASTGEGRWCFEAQGAFLQSPAVVGEIVVAASVDGRLYGLDGRSGEMRWSRELGHGGCAASPLVFEGTVLIGTRAGNFVAVDGLKGGIKWQRDWGVPVRQTAAAANGRVFVTAEDLRVRCLAVDTGELWWVSEPLAGQSARDYYPVVARREGGSVVMVRTNPVRGMDRQIARDRQVLARNAGVDDSDWRKLDAWVKSDAARGGPELWEREQLVIERYLEEDREGRTFYVLETETGREAMRVPMLWAAGCQGVGTPPARMADGGWLVFHRTAYGNWNLGVAPLVALGRLDLGRNRIDPLFHRDGAQPPWNTFWGTADESQNFTVAGQKVLIVHQGTLSGFDLRDQRLFAIWGERDTFGGFRGLSWARNEWHGPGRGGVAVDGDRLYWLTGSRLLCLAAGSHDERAQTDTAIEVRTVRKAETVAELQATELRRRLAGAVRELLGSSWAPLYVEPGLGGREIFFEDSGDVFQALAWAYPHLSATEDQDSVRSFLAREWQARPPFTDEGRRACEGGEPREWFRVPVELRENLDSKYHAFGNLGAIEWYADRCGEWDRVEAEWRRLKETFEQFRGTGWKLDGQRGHLYANRYLASLEVMARMARRMGDLETAGIAERWATETAEELLAWWRRVAAEVGPKTFQGVSELDAFIGKGEALSFRVRPHRHKVALFGDLTFGIGRMVRSREPESVAIVLEAFRRNYPTWHLAGEERQVHFGENVLDPPDLALSGFKAEAWVGLAGKRLGGWVDLPFCRADLGHIEKLAIALEEVEPLLR